MARTSTNNMKCKNEKDMISRFQELVNLLYKHFGVDKASPLYDKLVEKGYSFKRATFIGQMKATSTPTGTYIKKMIEVAQAEGFAIDDQYILHYSKCHSHLLKPDAGPVAAAEEAAAPEEPEIDFSEGEVLDLEGGETAAVTGGAGGESGAGEDSAAGVEEKDAPALDESEELQVPEVEESLAAEPAAELKPDAQEPASREEHSEGITVETEDDARQAEAVDTFSANINGRRAAVLTAREKWELAAADYGLEYDPDEMLAKDRDGVIHLFCMEHSRYVQKIYPKGTKISRLGSTRPQRTIEYSADKQMFRMIVSVVCTKVIEVEAESEVAATENISSTEMMRMKHFLETKDFEVSHPLIKCGGSYVKKDK